MASRPPDTTESRPEEPAGVRSDAAEFLRMHARSIGDNVSRFGEPTTGQLAAVMQRIGSSLPAHVQADSRVLQLIQAGFLEDLARLSALLGLPRVLTVLVFHRAHYIVLLQAWDMQANRSRSERRQHLRTQQRAAYDARAAMNSAFMDACWPLTVHDLSVWQCADRRRPPRRLRSSCRHCSNSACS